MAKAPGKKRVHAAGTAPRVAVIGGGIAGINSALQLIKAGFDVTLFEADPMLGGNTSSVDVAGTEHDVYPHMICDWYVNFWHMFENELGLSREAHFDARPSVKMRQKGKEGYAQLYNPTSIQAAIDTLKSGAMEPSAMFLLGFSELDLLGFPFERSGLNQLQQLDVNGFIYSRGYGIEPVAKMENYILSLIWSINSEQTAAATYQNFLRHAWQFPNHAPFALMLRSSLSKGLIAPAQARLLELGCKIHLNTQASCLRVEQDGPILTLTNTAGVVTVHEEAFDYVVCAIPAPALSSLAMSKNPDRAGRSIVECEPSLANLQRLQTVAIPVIDLYLKMKLPDFPKESIGLAGSRFGLTVLDISQLWEDCDFGGKTALVVAASDGASIPSADLETKGWLVLKELTEFYPDINPGGHWGDPDSDVDWTRSHVRENIRHKLFLNDVGSWAWRPATCYATMPRIAFAGDLCLNEVDMATVEGAVISGICAARAIQMADADLNKGKQRGKTIQALPHTVYSEAAFRAAKLWFLPAAYIALGFSAYNQWRDHKGREHELEKGNHYPLLDYLALVPLQYTIDWWKGAYWLARSLVDPKDQNASDLPDGNDINLLGGVRAGPALKPDELSDVPGQPQDIEIGLGSAILMLLGECADYAIDHFGKHPGNKAEQAVGGIAKLAQSFLGGLTDGKPKRRWRAKL